MARTARELKPRRELEGLSKRQIEEHHDVLYKGYVNKLNEIEAAVPEADISKANATYSTLRELKREEVFTTNAIRLHEGYFEALGGSGTPHGLAKEFIEEDFGSYEKWEAEFKGLGMAARGWVILGYDWQDHKLHTYLSDIHSDGVWDVSPVLILDVYEHAYFLDYGTARKAYIEAFMKNVDWEAVNRRIEVLNIQHHRKAA